MTEKYFDIPDNSDIKITIDGREFIIDKRHTLVKVEPRLDGQVVDCFYLDGLLPTLITGLDRIGVVVSSGDRINFADKIIEKLKEKADNKNNKDRP